MPAIDSTSALYLYVATGGSPGASTLTVDSLTVQRDTLVVSATFDPTGGCNPAAMTSNLQFDDAAEGIDAFLTKRPPHWRNS